MPVGDAIVDLLPGCAGLETHEGIGEIIADIVVLGREVIAFGFALLPDESGLLGILVHVVGDRSHVIEELGIDRPLAVFVPDARANEVCPAFGDRVAQGEALLAYYYVGKSLIMDAALVGAFSS